METAERREKVRIWWERGLRPIDIAKVLDVRYDLVRRDVNRIKAAA